MNRRTIAAVLIAALSFLSFTSPVQAMYNSGTGRFHTMDSYEGSDEEPRSLHKYLYGNAEPVTTLDPSGLTSIGELTFVERTQLTIMNMMVRAGPSLIRGTAFVYEAATGNAIYVGAAGGSVVGAYPMLSRIGGGIASWIKAANVLRNVKIGPYIDLSQTLKGLGEQAHHLNQAKAFSKIPYDEGVAVAMQGRVNSKGDLHRLAHESLENFWRQFRKGGTRAGQKPTNGEYDQALRKSLDSAGLLADEVNALADLARKHREQFKYFDGPGGLQPEVPNAIPGL